MGQLDYEQLNKEFERWQPQDILKWTFEHFDPEKIALTSSFQTESIVLLHMMAQINKAAHILFLETGWHFDETIQFKNEVVQLLGLTAVTDLKADPKKREISISNADGKPYDVYPDHCCQINKVEPLDQALKNYEAWISGIRRSQSKTRRDIRIIEAYDGGPLKINPMANVTSGDIWWYIKQHQLPKHPLWDRGYLSIGCWPCTKPVQAGDDERSGRWAGKDKVECGIHTFMKPKREQKPKESSAEKEQGGDI